MVKRQTILNKHKISPNNDPNAEEMDEINTPTTTTYLETQASCIAFMLVFNVARGNEAPIVTTNAQYTTMALPIAAMVPEGMLLAGSFKSPLKFAPSMIPGTIVLTQKGANSKWKIL